MGWSSFRKPGLSHHHSARSWKGYTLVTVIFGDATFQEYLKRIET